MSRRLVYILLFTSFGALGAQDFTFVNYGYNQGLHHVQVIDVSQDPYGNLWALPLTGSLIYRFDGRHFQRVNVSIKNIDESVRLFVIAADKNENLWLLTSIGVVRFDGKTFHPLTLPNSGKLSRQSVLYIDSNSVPWIIDDNGNIFSCSNDVLKPVSVNGEIKGKPVGISEYNKSSIAFTNRGELISLSTGDRISIPWLNADDRIVYIHSAGDDHVVITRTELVSRRGNSVRRQKHQFPVIQQALFYNNDVMVLSQGSISVWSGDEIKPIDTYPGFDNRFIQRIFKDRTNSIWIATDSQGIYNLTKQKAVNIPLPGNDIPIAIYPVGNDNLIAGTYRKGLVEINGRKVTDLGLKDLQDKVVMSAVKGPGNTVLIGTQQNGAFVMSPGNKIRRLEMGEANPRFVLPIAMQGEKVWVGSSFGLHQLSNTLVNQKNYSYQDLGVTAYFNFMYPLDSVMLIGSAGEGLLVFDPLTEKLTKMPGYEAESSLYLIKRDKHNQLWVGGEFSKILVLDKTLKRIAEIDLSKYCSNVLTFEFFDGDRVLVGSNDGIFTLTLGDGYRINSVRRLGLADGYKGGEVCMASMVRVEDKIWFGTSDGVYYYMINSDRENNPTPFTYINDLRLFNQETDWRQYADTVTGMYGLPRELRLEHGNNSLTFSFYANDFHDNEDLQFHYWLEGSNTSWSEYSTAENITYSSLPAGKYVFHVQSKDGVNLGNIVSFPFVILPAFWETTVFYFIVAIAVCVFIFALVRAITRLRIKRFKLNEQIRATESARLRRQMAMDFHDEMGNKLASVLAYSSSLKMVSASKENHELFDYFEKNAAAIYYGTKDFIWSIDVESNNLLEVITYLRDFGANFFEKHGIDFLVENDILNGSFNKQLPDGHNRQLVLLFKEAMTNVLKHSKATKVFFDATANLGTYRIILEDNGIGICKEGNGKGLKSMTDRAEKIAGRLKIDPVKPTGTRITLQFKV